MPGRNRDLDALKNFFYSWGFYQTDGKESDIQVFDYNNDLEDYFNAWQPDNELIDLSVESHLSDSSRHPQKWSSAEISLLTRLKQQNLSYAQISDEIKRQLGVHRSAIQIQQRWERIQKPGIKKGRFTSDENEILLAAIKSDFIDYQALASRLERTPYQIKRRVSLLRTSSAAE